MNPEPAAPPPRGGIIAGILLVLTGTILFLAGMIAGLRADGPARDALILGHAAWQVAVTGFLCTLGGGLWLQRLVK